MANAVVYRAYPPIPADLLDPILPNPALAGDLVFGTASTSGTVGADFIITNSLTFLANSGPWVVTGNEQSGTVTDSTKLGVTFLGNDSFNTLNVGLHTVIDGMTSVGVVQQDFRTGSTVALGTEATLTVEDQIADGTVVDFNGANSSFVYDSPAQLTLTVKDFVAGDSIDLPRLAGDTLGPGNETTVSVVDANGSGSAILNFVGGLPAGLTASDDGHGGILISTVTVTRPTNSGNFVVGDQTTGQQTSLAGGEYVGPVAGIGQQLVLITPDNLNISATVPNVFIHSGSGTDAIDVSRVNGNNVLDGSTGSNFLVGGTGRDTFFLDDRNAGSDTYSTVVNFHSGDNATILGVDPVNFHVVTQDNLGAVGAKGLTYTFTASGKPNASIVIAGFSTADLASGRLTASYGTNADLPGQPGSGGMYLNIHGN